MRFFIELSFNGDNYHGWQIQPNVITIQSEINRVLSIVLENQIQVTGAGRTDAGVHALQMYDHFDFDKPIEKEPTIERMNKILPSDILIKDIFQVGNDFHCRFNAISRTYKYYISDIKTPFKKNVFYVRKKLDVIAMNSACNYLLGKKDFTSFSKLKTQTHTNNCNIFHANWQRLNDGYLFKIKADRFLRNMVRAIVGTLIEVGCGNIEITHFKDIIDKRDRSSAGFSVPANALFLVNIEYFTNKKINNG